ncbi:MAG: hypothetical protein WAK40_02290 [Thermoplasmata archaeon]
MAKLSFGRKAVVVSVLVAFILAASSSIVMAAPLIGHAHPAAPSPSSGTDWGHHSAYVITFSESGLPTGTNWSVSLFGDSVRSDWQSNGSSNETIGFSLPNGTYDYSVSNTSNATAVFSATPSSGQVTVDGSPATVPVAFSVEPLYDVLFVESGLSSGTFWSAELSSLENGSGLGGTSAWSPSCLGTTYWNGSTTTEVAFAVPDGSYNFSIGNVTNESALYVPSPASGNVTVNGTSVTLYVSFASVPLYNLTFDETGLPVGASNGTFWYVVISNTSSGWFFNVSSNSSLGFIVPNGTYNFTVGNVSTNGSFYVPAPISGNVSVNGSDVVVSVSFARQALYSLDFVETGLPNGTLWAVSIPNSSTGGSVGVSANSTVGFIVPNGTYNFSVGVPFGSPWAYGPFCGNGTGNGSSFGGEYIATPQDGNATVDGSNVTVNIAFAPVTFSTVTFEETGLPNGTFWSVALDNSSFGGNASGWKGATPAWGGSVYFNASCSSSIGFTVPEGSYNFSVGNVSAAGALDTASPMSGNVTLNGTDLVVNITFSSVSLYHLTFVEAGLPNGSFWSVALSNDSTGGAFNLSGGSAVSFQVPNGTYGYSVGTFPYVWGGPTPFCSNGSSLDDRYVATPASGSVTVDGANVTVSIAFAEETFYTVSFVESGLPNGTFWWVSLNGSGPGGWGSAPIAESPAWGGNGSGGWGPYRSAINFTLPNGTFHFTVGNVSLCNGTRFVPTPASGSVTVDGANLTVTVRFADPPSGGHASAPNVLPGTKAPLLSAPFAFGLVVAVLALLGGGLALAWRRSGRPPTKNAPSDPSDVALPGTGLTGPK